MRDHRLSSDQRELAERELHSYYELQIQSMETHHQEMEKNDALSHINTYGFTSISDPHTYFFKALTKDAKF